MKKIVLLTLIGGIILSCKKEPVKDYLVLSGSVENFNKRDIKLEGFEFDENISFDRKAKNFVDTLKIDKDGYYSLTFNKRKFNIYLTKNEDLKILLDYNNPDAIKFEGTNAAIGTYFIKKGKMFEEQIGNLRDLLSLEEDAFLTKVEKYKKDLTDLAINSKLPESFLKKEIKNIDYEYLRDLYYYPKYYPALSGNKDFVVSESFPSVLDKINFNSGEDYVNSEFYRTILTEELQKITNDKLVEDGDFYLTYMETIQTEVNDSIVKNDLLFSKAQDGITFAEDLEDYYKKFMSYSTNKAHEDRITDIYNSLKLTAKGKPCPKFDNYENYSGGKTSLDDLLGKGKYLYIDVWATWCSFCKRETPLLKRLELQYHDKNIEFVSISVDNLNAKDKWKETIEQKEMGGVQLFADKSFGSDFIKKFAIKGLPRFIMVDPEGNIISPNAPRPSDGEKLINMFEELGI
ncbi:TlpA family protein disulfide reductase [Tenacibaculum sp. TC6]|uniref:TlpA family protein disulfide reductase n=1 Tax=Tenacibaculum sp. TC6 TaxID=3423223 RepID=UPI003D35ACFB